MSILRAFRDRVCDTRPFSIACAVQICVCHRREDAPPHRMYVERMGCADGPSTVTTLWVKTKEFFFIKLKDGFEIRASTFFRTPTRSTASQGFDETKHPDKSSFRDGMANRCACVCTRVLSPQLAPFYVKPCGVGNMRSKPRLKRTVQLGPSVV